MPILLSTFPLALLLQCPTSCEIDGETVETVSDFIFLGSIITADGDCSHEIKRQFFLGRKAMTNLDSILKSRDITLPTKFHGQRSLASYSPWGFKESGMTERLSTYTPKNGG